MKELYSNDEARDILEDVDVEYAVLNCKYTNFEDPTTRKMWQQTEEAITKLKEHLNEIQNTRTI